MKDDAMVLLSEVCKREVDYNESRDGCVIFLPWLAVIVIAMAVMDSSNFSLLRSHEKKTTPPTPRMP